MLIDRLAYNFYRNFCSSFEEPNYDYLYEDINKSQIRCYSFSEFRNQYDPKRISVFYNQAKNHILKDKLNTLMQ